MIYDDVGPRSRGERRNGRNRLKSPEEIERIWMTDKESVRRSSSLSLTIKYNKESRIEREELHCMTCERVSVIPGEESVIQRIL
jgi:hypothetical protein